MPALLVGSTGLQFHLSDIGRVPKDVDLIGTSDDLRELVGALRKKRIKVVVEPLSERKTAVFAGGDVYDFEIAWPGSTAAELLDHHGQLLNRDRWFIQYMPPAVRVEIPSLDVLYTLKLSHRYLKNSPHFLKTMADVAVFRSRGAHVFDEMWLKAREAETYDYKHPKLNVMKGDFFKGDGVEYVYDHDDIHVSMAHAVVQDAPGFPGKVPAYTLYMKEGAQVACDRKKFEALPEKVRLWGVLEEAQVLALERSQIPFRGKVDPKKSFDIALMKVCTSITSGWFREFAWEHYDQVQGLYEHDYVDRFWADVDRGLVRKL